MCDAVKNKLNISIEFMISRSRMKNGHFNKLQAIKGKAVPQPTSGGAGGEV
jgi:hypothetical protein